MNVILMILGRCDSLGFEIVRILLSILWQSSIVLSAAWMLSFILKNRRVSARYMVWVTALLVIPVIPLLTAALSNVGTPQTEIRILPAYTSPENRVVSMPPPFAERMPQENPLSTSMEVESQLPGDGFVVESGDMVEKNEHTATLSFLMTFPWALAFLAYTAIVIVLLLSVTRECLSIKSLSQSLR